MFRPIYTPRTRAREYCDLAINIYDGCPHGCAYCYARAMAGRFRRPWGTANARPGIVDAVKRQLAGMRDQGKKIMLCFTCDPYPNGCNSTTTREVIRAIKESGNHVQILTKGDAMARRDFDLLNGNDSFGVSWTGGSEDDEPGTASHETRRYNLLMAKKQGIGTWISCEPVIETPFVYHAIESFDFVDLFCIGKMNHIKSRIPWKMFMVTAEELCREYGRNYYIKEDLRREMEAL